MDGLGRASGAGKLITIQGKDYILSPLTIRHFGMVEQQILSNRPNPLKMVAEAAADLPEELAAEMMKQAYNDAKKSNTVSANEVTEWLETFEGMCYAFFLMLKKEQPEMTHEEVYDLMSDMTPQEMAQLQEDQSQVSGLDEAGN